MQNQIPEQIKQQRYDAVMQVQQEIAFTRNKSRVGEEFACLVDSVGEEKAGQGRFYGQAPDIDGVCVIEDCSARAGNFIQAKVVDARGYDLVVRLDSTSSPQAVQQI
jgi:ribosomal protein S12 methylthiotransferase